MRRLYLLGIDGGLNNLGYAVCTLKKGALLVFKAGTVHAEEKNLCMPYKLNLLAECAKREMKDLTFTIVAVELHKADRSIDRGVGAFLSQCKCCKDTLYVDVPVLNYKKGLGIITSRDSGIPGKDEVQHRLFALQKEGLISKLPPSGDDHMYDAIAIALFTYLRFTEKRAYDS